MSDATSERTIRILHVEDDPAHAELVRYAFQDHPLEHELQQAGSGAEALDYLFRRGAWADPKSSPRPDIVLLDLRLPGVDGLDVLREIRASRELAELPVVILTTSGADRDRLGAYEGLINGYVVKPFDFERFGQILDVLARVLTSSSESS